MSRFMVVSDSLTETIACDLFTMSGMHCGVYAVDTYILHIVLLLQPAHSLLLIIHYV